MKQKLIKSLRLRLFTLVAILCALFTEQAWGQAAVNDVLWSENWTGATTAAAGSDSATPSANYGKGTTVYNSGTVTYTQSANTVYVRNDTYAGGTAPELMLSSNKTWTISNIPTGGATELTLKYKSNNTKSSVTCSTSGASISGSSKSYTITTGGAETITLVFSCSGNTRIDDIEVIVKTAGGSTKTQTSVTLNSTSLTFDLADGETETLSATVKAGENTVSGATINWSVSQGSDYASVNSDGEVTPLASGTATIKASYSGDETYEASFAECTVTVTDSRTPVNITGFSAATNPIVKDNTTATNVTNNQDGWTAAYIYSSSDETVATIDADGIITTLKKGTTTITATLNVSASDQDYKAGSTTSMNFTLTVTNPSHNVTFSSNGSTFDGPTSVEEGESIELPETNPDDINGFTFVGWTAATINGTTNDEPTYVSAPTMGIADVTYYAVFADKETSEQEITKTYGFETVSDADWTIDVSTRANSQHKSGSYSGHIGKNNAYVTFKNKVYVTDFSFEFMRTSTNNNYYVYIETSTDKNTWTAIETYAMSSFAQNTWVNKSHTFNGETALYVRFHCYNTTADRYVDDVTIKYNESVTTYSDYCTTVSALPKPVITLSANSIDMIWGDTDKTLTASAEMGGSTFNGTIVLTPSDGNLTIDGSGNIRCNVPGTYTIEATIAGTETYQSATPKRCTVTVGKQTPTLSFAETTVQKLLSNGTYTQAATKSAEGVATPSYTITPSGNVINESTGAVTLSTTGNYTVTATAAENTLYNTTSSNYTLQVRKAPTISVSDDNVDYGDTYTVTGITGGTTTVTSSNTAVATISSLVITPVAVGTTTITVSTAANDTYIAGEETFELTVNPPAGSVEAKTASNTTTFTSQALGHADGELDWTASPAASGYEGTRRVQWQQSKGDFTLSLPNTETLKTVKIVASTNGSGNSISVAVGSVDFVNGNNTSINMNSGDSNKEFVFTGSSSGDVIISFDHSGSSVWVKSITIEYAHGTESITLNSSGYATFCSQYPLDFSETTGYSAWQITDINADGLITFAKITNAVKGGTGILLSGTASTTISIPSKDSSTELSSNLFHGTLAPEYFTAGEIFGLSGTKFVPNSAGTIKANKAYIDVDDIPAEVKSFTFVFEDTETGITETHTVTREEAEAIFDLNGRRLAKPHKGINIINGKKVLVK